jgi:hypothetical protein
LYCARKSASKKARLSLLDVRRATGRRAIFNKNLRLLLLRLLNDNNRKKEWPKAPILGGGEIERDGFFRGLSRGVSIITTERYA